MSVFTMKNFIAIRKPNGDVCIRAGYWADKLIIIPKEYCAELAQLLCSDALEPDYKVDYSRCAREPE